MHSTLSTITALIASLSLVSAAPAPQRSSGGSQIGIKVQLAGFDAASVTTATLDQTTVARQSQIKEAEVNEAGPWCAGFSDARATRPARALNGDGIFDSANPAVYSRGEQTVTVASYWCAATRGEVENFVARAVGGGQNNNGGNNGGNNGNGNENNGGNNNGGGASTVRVQIELEAGTTFVQSALPANGQVTSASTVRNLGSEVVSIQVVGQGNCQFFANNRGTRAAQFPGVVRSFRCSA